MATYGPFDLTNAASSVLTFAFTGASEQNTDVLYAAASIDDYYYCGGSYSGDYSSGYFQGTLDLSDLSCPGQPPTMLGHTNVTLAFMAERERADLVHRDNPGRRRGSVPD